MAPMGAVTHAVTEVQYQPRALHPVGSQVHYLVKQAGSSWLHFLVSHLYGLRESLLRNSCILVKIMKHGIGNDVVPDRRSWSFYLEALTQDGPILLGMRIYQDFYAYESGQGHVHAHRLAWFILDCWRYMKNYDDMIYLCLCGCLSTIWIHMMDSDLSVKGSYSPWARELFTACFIHSEASMSQPERAGIYTWADML